MNVGFITSSLVEPKHKWPTMLNSKLNKKVCKVDKKSQSVEAIGQPVKYLGSHTPKIQVGFVPPTLFHLHGNRYISLKKKALQIR